MRPDEDAKLLRRRHWSATKANVVKDGGGDERYDEEDRNDEAGSGAA